MSMMPRRHHPCWHCGHDPNAHIPLFSSKPLRDIAKQTEIFLGLWIDYRTVPADEFRERHGEIDAKKLVDMARDLRQRLATIDSSVKAK